MKKEATQLSEIKLVGITTRTNNKHLLPSTNAIAATVQKYMHNGLSEQIQGRKTPGTTYCVYTNYESDHTGDYTYFIGEAVADFESVPEGFETLTIPSQNYMKFTNGPGPMPTVCIEMWQDIWQMDASDLGGERRYIADFEIYDERSADHANVTLDVYIGVS